MTAARSSAKSFFILVFVLSFFGRTVYNNNACLDCLDWGWQRPGVVTAMPGHLSYLFIITASNLSYKPPRGMNILRVQRQPPYCFPKQHGGCLFVLSVLTDICIVVVKFLQAVGAVSSIGIRRHGLAAHGHTASQGEVAVGEVVDRRSRLDLRQQVFGVGIGGGEGSGEIALLLKTHKGIACNPLALLLGSLKGHQRILWELLL
jgi:hypothetical protein